MAVSAKKIRELRKQLILHGNRNTKLRKKPPRWLPPMPVERQYKAILIRSIANVRESYRKFILPMLPSLVDKVKGLKLDSPNSSRIVNMDSWLDDANALVKKMKDDLANKNKKNLDDIKKMSNDTSNWNKKEWKKITSATIGVDVVKTEPWLAPALDSWATENAALISSLDDAAIGQVEKWTLKGLREGWRHEEIANMIEERFGVSESKAEFIARDQISKLNGNLTMERQQSVGVEKYYWRAINDERTRQTHAAHDGKIFSWDDPPSDTGHPGEDYNCFPGSQLFHLAGQYEIIYRRWYDGELTNIITDSGKSFSATPNHPILTLTGWKAIKDLQIGEDIIEVSSQGINGIENNIDHTEMPFSKIFDALSIMGSLHRVNGSSSQFHNDGSEYEVDIIRANSLLSDKINLIAIQEICELVFAIADEEWVLDPLPTFSDLGSMLRSLFNVPDALVRGIGKLHSLYLSESAHPEIVGLASVSKLDALLLQASVDSGATAFEFNRQGKSAITGQIHFGDFRIVQLSAIMCRMRLTSDRVADSFYSEELANAVSIYGKRSSNIRYSDSLIVKHHRILNKSISEFSGHVYNLQTSSGWYKVNRIAVKNCRCSAEPILTDLLEGLQQEEDGGGE